MLKVNQDQEDKIAKESKDDKNKKKVVKKVPVLVHACEDSRRVFKHIVEAISIQEMEGWLKEFVQKQIFEGKEKP